MSASVFATDLSTIAPVGTSVSITSSDGNTYIGTMKTIGTDFLVITNTIAAQSTASKNIILPFTTINIFTVLVSGNY